MGVLNVATLHPWGFMPDITFFMVPSFPAASMAWNMISSAVLLSAYSFC